MSEAIRDSVDLASRLARAEAEREQALVALEDAHSTVLALSEERHRLQQQIDEQAHAQMRAQSALRDLHTQLSRGTDRQTGQLEREQARAVAAEEELRVTVEELQVLAEELENANDALRTSNDELDRRVAQRTMELGVANTALADSRERLRLALRSAAVGTWEWSVADDHLLWSPEYLELHGQSTNADVVARRADWAALILPDDRAATEAALLGCLEDGGSEWQYDYRILHPTKGIRWMAARARVIRDARGRPERLIGVISDVTERRVAELAVEQSNVELNRRVQIEVAAREEAQSRQFQQQKLEALGQLTGGVAHDFNNLLTIVQSGLDLLTTIDEPARRARVAERIRSAVTRGGDLTRRLLSFGRREALRPQPVSLASRMRELQDLFVHSLRGDIAVAMEFPDDLWPIEVDPAAFDLALLNLAVNSRDAMPSGGTITLRAHNATLGETAAMESGVTAGDYVRVSIADTGSGIPPELMTRVFEPFFTTKDVGVGTGLGLPQVYGFTKQSGGTVRIESSPGQGTEVTMVLPRATQEPQQTAIPAAMSVATVRAEGKVPSVLVVEDNDEVAALLLDLLQQFGYRAQRVSNATAALGALASDWPLDLVLTDVLLPGGASGLDLAREVPRRRPGLPILLTTGYSGDMPSEIADCKLPLLRKPYRPEMLRAMVEAVLARTHESFAH